jgi:hypothetical protein
VAGSPQVPLGNLNRILASVVWPGFTFLNVTAPFLGADGVSLTFEGEATQMLPVMVGVVPSPEVYQLATLTISLLKTQFLANLYKAQYEANVLLGNCTIYPDSAALQPYTLINTALTNIRELRFSGQDPTWVVTARGTYQINAALYG